MVDVPEVRVVQRFHPLHVMIDQRIGVLREKLHRTRVVCIGQLARVCRGAERQCTSEQRTRNPANRRHGHLPIEQAGTQPADPSPVRLGPPLPEVMVYQRAYTRRRPPAGDRSINSAITIPMIGISDHWPWNQCWTAVYHSNVVGRNTNPSTGHSAMLKMPLNQCVNSHNSTITTRGTNSANNTIRQGMPILLSAWDDQVLPGTREPGIGGPFNSTTLSSGSST